jgi:hypothetical protein
MALTAIINLTVLFIVCLFIYVDIGLILVCCCISVFVVIMFNVACICKYYAYSMYL